MTQPKDDKETRILDAAASLFANEPFHKVLLDDVARRARVGKGTLYLYFKSKDELYLSVLFREFSALVDRLHARLDLGDAPADEQMADVVAELVRHVFGKSAILDLLRGAVVNCSRDDRWDKKRLELRDTIEGVIRRGINQGLFQDEQPEITAQYISGMIRSACLFRPEGVGMETIAGHATNFILQGLATTVSAGTTDHGSRIEHE